MNPLSALRKLGIAIVGKDGILDTTVASYHGFGPMAKVKIQEEARDRLLKEKRDALGLQSLELGNKKTGIDIDAAQTNLSQDKELFPGVKKKQGLDIAGQELDNTGKDIRNTGDLLDNAGKGVNLRNAERAEAEDIAAAEFLAKKLGVTADKALGVVKGWKELNASGSARENADGTVKIEDTDVVSERNADRKFKAEMAQRERQFNRQLDRDKERDQTTEDKAFSEVDKAGDAIKRDPEYRADRVIVERYNQMQDALNSLNSTEVNKDISKGVVTPVMITAFNKILDPVSVVRETEYARTAEEQSLIRKVKGYISSFTEGSTIDLRTLEEIKKVTSLIANRAKERYAVKVQDFKARMQQRPLTSTVPETYIDNLFNNTSKSSRSSSNLTPAQKKAMGMQ